MSKEWLKVFHSLNESQRRWLAASKSVEIGYGGISKVSRATGLSRTTVTQGIREINENKELNFDQMRKQGGGRKKLHENQPGLIEALDKILNESSAGDPMTLLKWTIKSSNTIAKSLEKQDFTVSYRSVQHLLKKKGYSLQCNKKMLSGKNHPDRDTQFKHINRTVNRFIKNNDPVISVDTKKKELVGNFKNDGRVWTPKKSSIKVLDHDFRSCAKGIAIPYGAYDVSKNEGFVNVGITSDTSEFAVNSIWQWWRHFGRKHYKHAANLLICADGGGSNGNRSRAWKFFLQELANRIGISITVCHYPPGTSKWNKIEHRMFSFISLNWKGRPLENYESVVQLISATKTKKGLTVKARLDKVKYKKGIKISDEEFETISLKFNKKFPSWNYTIHPII